MRKVFVLAVLAAASFTVAAQQSKEEQPQQPDQKSQQDPAMTERMRIEGAAGGTAPVPDEKRKPVGAGAGPHLKDNLPSPQKLPRDKPVEPPK